MAKKKTIKKVKAAKKKAAKKKAAEKRAAKNTAQDGDMIQVNVRMHRQLFDLIVRDAQEEGRTHPGQIRWVLRRHYKRELD